MVKMLIMLITFFCCFNNTLIRRTLYVVSNTTCRSIDIQKIGKNNKSTYFIETIKFPYIQARSHRGMFTFLKNNRHYRITLSVLFTLQLQIFIVKLHKKYPFHFDTKFDKPLLIFLNSS